MKRITLALILIWAYSSAAHSENTPPGQGFIDAPGGPVWYRITGEGEGIPLLTLHGGPGGTSCGFSLLEVLGSERPVVRYDQLGSGRSGRPDDLSLWNVERFVEELHVLRRELGLGQMHLLGHSWGGSLAAAYVLEKGTDGIASVILSSPLLSTPDWIADAKYLRSQLPEDVQQVLTEHEEAGTIDSEEYEEASAVFYERHMSAGDPIPRPANCDGSPWSQLIYRYMWGPSEFYADGTLTDFNVTDRLHEIDAPVLFITGEFDEARPETVEGYQKRIPGSRFYIVEGAGHATYSKKTKEYLRVLEEFLDSVDAQLE